MKNMILITIFFVAIFQLILPTKASAFLGIPGTPAIPGDPGDVLRAAERTLKCQQIRDDADHHQAELKQTLASGEAFLTKANTDLNDKLVLREKFLLLNATWTKQNAILREFPILSSELVLSANDFKSAILNIISNNSNQSLDEVFQAMESNPNPTLRQFALLIRPIILKPVAELSELLDNEKGQVLLSQTSVLIGSSQILLVQGKAQIDDFVSQNEAGISQATQSQAQYAAQINQARAELNAQEERKSCNF